MRGLSMGASAFKVVRAFLKVSESQLEMGKKVEEEHDDVYEYFSKLLKKHDIEMPLSRDEFFEKIARAHIAEIKDYYDRLKKMEGEHHKEAMDFTSISPLLTPDKKLTDSEIARALRLSIAAELDAVHLYELIADSVGDKKVQEVMKSVANEEKVHAGEFTEILSRFDKNYDQSVEKGRKEVKR
jgi:hypothetical protein